MHVEYLKYFHDVASTGSISKVANDIHISQPALSQQIQKLEETLGYRLLNRSNKGVVMTEAGRIVEKHSRTLLKAYDNMLEDLAEINHSNNTVRIDSSPTVATYALPCTIYSIKEKHPEYKVSLSTNLANDVMQSVLSDVCDFGFIHGKPDNSELSAFKVGVDRLAVVAPYDAKIAGEVKLSELQRYELIMLVDKFEVARDTRALFRQAGYSLDDFNVILNLDSVESIKSTVIKGFGISVLPYVSIKKELYNKQLKEVKIPGLDMGYEIYLIYKQSKEMRRCVKNCISYYKNIGEESFC